jgi:hypothetical protein
MNIYHLYPQSTEPTRFSKPPRLIEKATSDPEEVIKETFAQTPPDELQNIFFLTGYALRLLIPIAHIQAVVTGKSYVNFMINCSYLQKRFIPYQEIQFCIKNRSTLSLNNSPSNTPAVNWQISWKQALATKTITPMALHPGRPGWLTTISNALLKQPINATLINNKIIAPKNAYTKRNHIYFYK